MKQTDGKQLLAPRWKLLSHGTGPTDMRAAAYGAHEGTNIRVGQEDNVTERPGRLVKSNASRREIPPHNGGIRRRFITPHHRKPASGLTAASAQQVAPMAVFCAGSWQGRD